MKCSVSTYNAYVTTWTNIPVTYVLYNAEYYLSFSLFKSFPGYLHSDSCRTTSNLLSLSIELNFKVYLSIIAFIIMSSLTNKVHSYARRKMQTCTSKAPEHLPSWLQGPYFLFLIFLLFITTKSYHKG